MVSKTMIADARTTLIKDWREDAKRVIDECAKVIPFNGDSKAFLDYCYCCGGDWGAMLLTGIKKLYPEVWDAIPNNMGVFAFVDLCNVLILCGVDTSAE